jgi:hypothetical protein
MERLFSILKEMVMDDMENALTYSKRWKSVSANLFVQSLSMNISTIL